MATTDFKVDLLKLYFGDPYPITDKIIINQPSLQDIINYGEEEFFAVMYIFIGNTTYRKLFLWENGIDWNKMSNYELFCNLVRALPEDKTNIILPGINFENFVLYKTNYDESQDELPAEEKIKLTRMDKLKRQFEKFEKSYTLYDKERGIELSADVYHKMVAVLRQMLRIFPKDEYAFGKETKQLLIDEAKEKLKKAEREEAENNTSTLLPLISACVNHPGFKYRKDELRNVQIYEFMDSVGRLQLYESTHALLGGMYSGFCDTSKIPNDKFDFMRPI